MRYRIYSIITKATGEDVVSRIYDGLICLVVIFSLAPLMWKSSTLTLVRIDTVTMYVLILDYLLRWCTCDLADEKPGNIRSFLLFPVRPLSILAVLGIIPSLGILNKGWRILRLMRIGVLLHYSSQLDLVTRVLKKQSRQLLSVLGIAISYIYAIALVLFNYEPDAFNNFFEAAAYAATMVTSISYQESMPHTVLAQTISLVSSVFGIAIIALPTGIITSGFMEAIQERAQEAKEMQQSKETPTLLLHGSISYRPLNGSTVRKYTIIMLLCMLLNIGGYRLASALGLPVWLDTLGTIVAALLLEPTAALMVGFVNNMIMAISFGNFAILYYTISAMTAIVVDLFLRDKRKILYKRIPLVMMAVSVAAGLMSFCNYELFDHTGLGSAVALNVWEEAIYDVLVASGAGHKPSIFWALLLVKLLDMIVCFGLTTVICLLYEKFHGKPEEMPCKKEMDE